MNNLGKATLNKLIINRTYNDTLLNNEKTKQINIRTEHTHSITVIYYIILSLLYHVNVLALISLSM